MRAFAAAALVLLALGACKRTKVLRPDDARTPVMERRVRGDLQKLGVAVVCKIAKTKTGPEAQVDVTDQTGTDHDFSYRFDWVAPDGRLVSSSNSAWTTAHVPANGKTTITSTPPVPDATDYKLNLKE